MREREKKNTKKKKKKNRKKIIGQSHPALFLFSMHFLFRLFFSFPFLDAVITVARNQVDGGR